MASLHEAAPAAASEGNDVHLHLVPARLIWPRKHSLAAASAVTALLALTDGAGFKALQSTSIPARFKDGYL